MSHFRFLLLKNPVWDILGQSNGVFARGQPFETANSPCHPAAEEWETVRTTADLSILE